MQHITTCEISKDLCRMTFIALYACLRKVETLKVNDQSSNIKKLPKKKKSPANETQRK